MSRYRIGFIIMVCLALGLAVVKSQGPGGGTIPWFIGFLLLTLLNYYFGFVDRGHNPFRFLSSGAQIKIIRVRLTALPLRNL
jgi:uncharacterized membrane protein YadS